MTDKPDPRATGLLDARGEPIMRAPNPVGFAVPKPKQGDGK